MQQHFVNLVNIPLEGNWNQRIVKNPVPHKPTLTRVSAAQAVSMTQSGNWWYCPNHIARAVRNKQIAEEVEASKRKKAKAPKLEAAVPATKPVKSDKQKARDKKKKKNENKKKNQSTKNRSL